MAAKTFSSADAKKASIQLVEDAEVGGQAVHDVQIPKLVAKSQRQVRSRSVKKERVEPVRVVTLHLSTVVVVWYSDLVLVIIPRKFQRTSRSWHSQKL